MQIAENLVQLATPLARSWLLLLDLRNYAAWHPFVTMEGRARQGTRVAYRHRSSSRFVPDIISQALITDLSTHRRITWRIGSRFALAFEESFLVERSASGTLLRHRYAMRGPFSIVGALLFGNWLRTSIVIVDQSLAAYAKRGTTAAHYFAALR